MMSSIFVVGPITTLRNTHATAKRVEPMTGPVTERLQAAGLPIRHDPVLFVRVNAGVQLAGAAALASGRCPRLAAAVLAATLVPTTLAGHAFWREEDPEQRARMRVEFAKNVSLFGGLVIAALDTDGKPGKAWLARQAGKRIARRAEQLSTTTKLEAKIAALEAAGAGDHLAETLEHAGGQAREAASRWAPQVKDVAAQLGEHARGMAAEHGPQVKDAAAQLGEHARDAAAERAAEWAPQVRDAAGDWGEELRTQGRRRGKELRKEAKAARKRGGKRAQELVDQAKAKVA